MSLSEEVVLRCEQGAQKTRCFLARFNKDELAKLTYRKRNCILYLVTDNKCVCSSDETEGCTGGIVLWSFQEGFCSETSSRSRHEPKENATKPRLKEAGLRKKVDFAACCLYNMSIIYIAILLLGWS